MSSERSPSIRILAVVVLYRLLPGESRTFTTLLQSAERLPKTECKILLYDNSPSLDKPNSFPSSVMYEAATVNRGLATAYNRAIEIAIRDGYNWLLTLDQDTSLPEDFLALMVKRIEEVRGDLTVAAVMPQIWGNGKRLSPNRFLAGVWPHQYPRGFVGISSHPTFAFNSGSFFRIEALREVGGYDARFWLDYCDACIYRQLQKHGKRVFIAGDIAIQHEFSMQDFKNRVSLARYSNIVSAGSAFWDLEMSALAGLDHTARLMFRILKHLWRGDDRQYRKITIRMLKKRLLNSKKQRLEEWEKSFETPSNGKNRDNN